MSTVTTSSFHFDVEACSCADCTAVRTPKPEHHVETLEIEGPASEVESLKEACAHLTSGYITQHKPNIEVVRFLLSQPHPWVLEYEAVHLGVGRRAASVTARVLGVSVCSICNDDEPGYELLLEARHAS